MYVCMCVYADVCGYVVFVNVSVGGGPPGALGGGGRRMGGGIVIVLLYP